MRKTGPGDISYCATECMQENCKRNLKFWKAPTHVYSVSKFDLKCKNKLHSDCEYKYLDEGRK